MKDSKFNWCYETDEEPNLNHRRLSWPRGKVLGGTSSINGMVYIRGQQEDYDDWAQAGNKGWSYKELLPYFKNGQHFSGGASQYHGIGGPLWVDTVQHKFELADLFIQAGIESGIPYNDDFNGEHQEGVGFYQLNIKNGLRQSTARTFLKLCKNRPNLDIKLNALTQKIIFKDKQAVAATYLKNNKSITAVLKNTKNSEIILCGGTINSPQLLELSGVGNSDILRDRGVEPIHHLPGVGENLQDHLTVNIQQKLKNVNTFYQETRPLQILKNILSFFVQRKGLLTHPAAQAGGFFKIDDNSARADAQIHFTPAAGESNAKGNIKAVPGTTATVCYLRPSSRGSVHIKSNAADVYPSIKANYLATEEDKQKTIDAVRKIRAIFLSPTMDRYREAEIQPGPAVQTDEQILGYIREKSESVYHPVGTCKMGHDEMAVVDDQLKVHGIQGLRVADASIMPTILSGNTNAACIMIAEKCADMILAARNATSSKKL
jgi:choline dehydrogenase